MIVRDVELNVTDYRERPYKMTSTCRSARIFNERERAIARGHVRAPMKTSRERESFFNDSGDDYIYTSEKDRRELLALNKYRCVAEKNVTRYC